MNNLVKVVMGLMFVVVVFAWSVIGFLLWIPLLVRATTVFSAMVVHATMSGQRLDGLRGHLEAACRFYPNGFKIAYEVINLPSNNHPTPVQVHYGRVAAESIWTVLFWAIFLAIFHPSLLRKIQASFSIVGDFSNWLQTEGRYFSIIILISALLIVFAALQIYKNVSRK
jgi:hypothetical protein